MRTISVWLRNVGDDEIDDNGDECWVPCAKSDPGAVEFVATVPLYIQNREEEP